MRRDTASSEGQHAHEDPGAQRGTDQARAGAVPPREGNDGGVRSRRASEGSFVSPTFRYYIAESRASGLHTGNADAVCQQLGPSGSKYRGCCFAHAPKSSPRCPYSFHPVRWPQGHRRNGKIRANAAQSPIWPPNHDDDLSAGQYFGGAVCRVAQLPPHMHGIRAAKAQFAMRAGQFRVAVHRD